MDERFEDALRLKKERIELESKVEAFSGSGDTMAWYAHISQYDVSFETSSRENCVTERRSWTTLRIFASLFESTSSSLLYL